MTESTTHDAGQPERQPGEFEHQDAAGEFTHEASDAPRERPIGDDPVIEDPADGRDGSPVEEGDQDLPSTLDAEDPLRDALEHTEGEAFPPPPIR